MKDLEKVMKPHLAALNNGIDEAERIIVDVTEQLGEGRFDIPKEKQFYTHCDCHREKILAIEVKNERLFLWADIMSYNVFTLPFWEQWEAISKLYDIFAVGTDPEYIE